MCLFILKTKRSSTPTVFIRQLLWAKFYQFKAMLDAPFLSFLSVYTYRWETKMRNKHTGWRLIAAVDSLATCYSLKVGGCFGLCGRKSI